MLKEAGLRSQRGTLYSTSHHSTHVVVTWKVCEERGGGGGVVEGAGGGGWGVGALTAQQGSLFHQSTFVRKEAGLKVQRETLYFTNQHSTTW